MGTSEALIVDTHIHAHWPQRYGYLHNKGSRLDKNETALSAEGLFPALRKAGVTHTLLIQPGAYEFDNSAMLDVVAASNGAARALAALPYDASEDEFVRLKALGVVGVRLSLVTLDPGLFENEKVGEFLERCRRHDFWVEILARAPIWPSIIPHLAKAGVKVIVEHFGYPTITEGVKEQGIQAILKFARSSNAVFKLSCGYRISWEKQPYTDMRPHVMAFLEAFGLERTIWGSDWPFLNPDQGPVERPIKAVADYSTEFGALDSWVPNKADRHKILWENPSRFFGFQISSTIADAAKSF